MLEAIDSYDWAEAFGYCGDAGYDPTGTNSWYSGACTVEAVERIPGQQDKVSNAPCLREDVVEILGIAEGENDGPEWLLLAKMRDGRFLSLSAGCDYTGWD